MSAIRDHDVPPPSFDDDDGMPPLVDNPNPSMTFTFFTDMTPITALSADPTIPFESVWDNPVPVPASPADPSDLSDTHVVESQLGPDRASHAKKRDASYIPRPPNAFILFRSSFIRSQQVPEKVEGNHSTLSKIIGKYWKTLPREEREVWEAKALVAQAEHRKRYPDWRFRPGANAFAKLKVKDGPQTPSRKRGANSQAGRKAKGDPAGKKAKSGDERCAIIADLLVEGKTGVDLEDAVRRWEDTAARALGGRSGTKTSKDDQGDIPDEDKPISISSAGVSAPSANGPKRTPPQPRAQTPDASHDDRFRVSLTAMFKRSLSAPAAGPLAFSHDRQDPLDSVFANVSYDIADSPQGVCPPSLSSDQPEDPTTTTINASAISPDCLSPLLLPSILREGVAARWNDPYNLLETSIGLPPPSASSPECPELTYALHTPPSVAASVSVSPVTPSDHHTLTSSSCFAPPYNNNFSPAANAHVNANTNASCTGFGNAAYTARDQAYYAPKSWADCAVLSMPPQEDMMMPIFINEYAGQAYDWCGASAHEADYVATSGACVSSSPPPDADGHYVYVGADTGAGVGEQERDYHQGSPFGSAFGDGSNEYEYEYDYVRAHAGECLLPAVAY